MKTHPNQRWPDKKKSARISSKEISQTKIQPKPFEKEKIPRRRIKNPYVSDRFKKFVDCTHDDIDHDDYGCNSCKLCHSRSSDRNELAELREKFAENPNAKINPDRFDYDYGPYTKEQVEYVRNQYI